MRDVIREGGDIGLRNDIRFFFLPGLLFMHRAMCTVTSPQGEDEGAEEC